MRISVGDLDSWRYYRSSEMELESFLLRLQHKEPPNRAMLAGRALHKILEHASAGETRGEAVEYASMHGFTFRFAADCALPALPVCELKAEIELATASGPVTLVGVVDGIDGTIYDHKLTERFHAERYAESYQWRCYLWMFHARKFTYNVFEGKEENGEWVIWGFQRLDLYAYEGMYEDVLAEVSGLADFMARYLPERA